MSKFFGDHRYFHRLQEEAGDDGAGESQDVKAEDSPDKGDEGGEPSGDEGGEKKSLVNDPEDKPEEKESKEPSEKRNVAPEKYDLKLPENSDVDDSVVKSVEEFAKENGLSQEAAQSILDREMDARQASIRTLEEQASKQSETWLKEAKADPDIGGDKWNESVALADKALDELFPSMDIKEFLRSTGLGNNPSVIKGFRRIGEMLTSEKIDPSTQPFGQNKNKLAKFYDHPTSQTKS